jgi:phage terminase large subunit-like protein
MYSQTPKLEAGSLILPKSAPWLSEFLEEYLAFPDGRYNDQIDALSQFLSWRTIKILIDLISILQNDGTRSTVGRLIAYLFRRR